MNNIKIAGLHIDLDCPDWLIHESLKKFEAHQSKADIIIRIEFGNPPPAPENKQAIRLRGYAKSFIDESGSIYIENYDPLDIPNYSIITNNWSNQLLYINPSYNNCCDHDNLVYVQSSLLAILREHFIPSLVAHNGVLVHSASIELDDKAVLFSAPAGTGKTTHTNLWKEKYGIQVLDGDVTACRIIDGSPYAYGLPWCGSSGKFLNKRLPLKAVFFLEQSERNEISKLDVAEAVVRLYARSFLYLSDEAVVDQVLKTIQNLVSCADCYLLKCRPDFEAVELVRKCLEKE